MLVIALGRVYLLVGTTGRPIGTQNRSKLVVDMINSLFEPLKRFLNRLDGRREL
jgi:hypothetical protein